MYNLRFHELMGFLQGPEDAQERIGVCYPPLDVYENGQGLVIEVELPGIDPGDVSVEVSERILRISGMKDDPLRSKDVEYKRMERIFGRFIRELEIPERFSLETVNARFRDGVLIITIERAQNKVDLVRHIEIE
ncbi:MAG: Hsp20/alpha crystallin family protein [Thermodesulfobacteriota bacterium]|nr:Hsp20/alpha crystallin family protein [Thermodesulfobacteriota bacterium]